MSISSIRTLLIEDNPADARVLREALAEVHETNFEVEWVDGLANGLERLNAGPVDLVLLDLSLPDSRGLATFTTTHRCAPRVPIIVLTGLDDRELALKAVRDGAQDYLVKGQFQPPSLLRAMQHAVVRHRMHEETVDPSWKDDLTGLYNRHGFLVLSEQFLRLADESKCTVALVYADVDGLGWINHVYGREEGDAALQAVAEALRQTSGGSDLVARVGGDEFALMYISLSGPSEVKIESMLNVSLQRGFSHTQRPYPLAVSWGVAVYDPGKPLSIAELMKSAETQARPTSHNSVAQGEGGTGRHLAGAQPPLSP